MKGNEAIYHEDCFNGRDLDLDEDDGVGGGDDDAVCDGNDAVETNVA